jgi:hypothetical protein
MEYDNLKLQNLNQGAAEDLFNEELDRVLRNIHDVNTKPDAVREIKLIVKIKPSKDRATATTALQASSKLAPAMPHEGSVLFSFQNNKPKAYTNNLKQMTIDDLEKTDSSAE